MPIDDMLLRVVTPQGSIMEERASSVALWTAMGEIEILPGHAPTVVLLEPGEMRVYTGTSATERTERVFAAGDGFAQISQHAVTVFSDMAEDAEGIAMEREQEAKRRAELALNSATPLTADERAITDLRLREAMAKIQISLRRKHGRTPGG